MVEPPVVEPLVVDPPVVEPRGVVGLWLVWVDGCCGPDVMALGDPHFDREPHRW